MIKYSDFEKDFIEFLCYKNKFLPSQQNYFLILKERDKFLENKVNSAIYDFKLKFKTSKYGGFNLDEFLDSLTDFIKKVDQLFYFKDFSEKNLKKIDEINIFVEQNSKIKESVNKVNSFILENFKIEVENERA